MSVIPQPDPETRWTLGAWLFLGVVLFAIFGQLLLTLAGFELPADGWNHRNNFAKNQVTLFFQISDQPSALRVNDVILALNGQPLQVVGPYPDLGEIAVGQTIRYTIERDGKILDVDVPLIKRSWMDIVRYWQRADWAGLVASLLTVLVVGFAFSKRPGSVAARILFLIIGVFGGSNWFGFADFSVWQIYYPPHLLFWLVLGGSAWVWLVFPGFIHLVLIFPIRLWPIQKFPRLLLSLLYSIPALLSLPYLVQLLLYRDSSGVNIWSVTLLGLIGIFALTFCFATIHNWRTPNTPVAHAQIRWVAFGLAGWVGTALLFSFTATSTADESFRTLLATVSNLASLSLPICLTIAILRYRLFDIDVIIRRTLQYSVLSGLLGLTYFGLVIVLQNLTSAVGGQRSEIITVLSTLAIAALFFPLRNRVQEFIDKRFFRKKYDAQKVLAEFAATCRDETDLDKLTARLAEVIDETLQPEKVSVWIKPTADGGRQTAEAKTGGHKL